MGQQEWHDVLFMHWPVPYEILRPYIPQPFSLETYDEQAWITIILFQAKNSRFRAMPNIMSYPPFLQMNTRTYIQFDGKPGIYFLSVDVNHLLVQVASKRLLQLPYELANMDIKRDRDHISFKSNRINSGYLLSHITANYRPLSQQVHHPQGTLSHWLTERYCFWLIKGTKIIKGPLSHEPWELDKVTVTLGKKDIIPFITMNDIQEKPIAHYAKFIHAHLHPFEQIGIYRQST